MDGWGLRYREGRVELDFVIDTQTQEVEDDGASVLFNNLFSHRCVRRVVDPES